MTRQTDTTTTDDTGDAGNTGSATGRERADRAGQPQRTFETDVSETGPDGTTVRQAEVREGDLAEVPRPPAPGR
ncbi:hypothetical protein [Burkholderia perseverans]|uniref:hypothetical protein n=1 Tax=Burkholderia perseverans TaxID=2615214 RepID=UPI001FED3E6E|nr:hypothetical protein [Burkholderia perseverans]